MPHKTTIQTHPQVVCPCYQADPCFWRGHSLDHAKSYRRLAAPKGEARAGGPGPKTADQLLAEVHSPAPPMG
jgi:hypothetical protein